MNVQVCKYMTLATILLAVAFIVTSAAGVTPASAAPVVGTQRFLIQAKSAADYDGLRADVAKAGGRVLGDLRPVNLMVVTLPPNVSRAMVEQNVHVAVAARDGIRRLVTPAMQAELFGKPFSAKPQKTVIQVDASKLPQPAAKAPNIATTPDPAYGLAGLLWNLDHIHAPQAWSTLTTGLPTVSVGVADTGLDYTHSELAGGKVAQVVDFTYLEEPYPICQTFFGGTTDTAIAASWPGGAVPSNLDFNGHGSWIGGNIAANLDNVGINGIAPNIKLVALKISQYCGSAYDSEILSAFVYAADNRIDIVSISFGGYTNRSDPEQNAIYKQYVRVVNYAKTKGTVIVAAAGNEHLRVGATGQVISHGSLTTPGDKVVDSFGWYETPGGVPGVVDVSATGNIVNLSSATCDPATIGSTATCKPTSDKHKAPGAGKKNQLAYYSNYGPRIDVTAPGGARKFNLPVYDRGGTPGFPVTTADLYNAWEDFSITSNYALEIPCYVFTGSSTFYNMECYTSIQGTSMATPHASAVLALIASVRPDARYIPDQLIYLLKASAQKIKGNTTQPLSAGDKSKGDLSGIACTTGYCHLGGLAISDKEAYGAGLVDAPYLAP